MTGRGRCNACWLPDTQNATKLIAWLYCLYAFVQWNFALHPAKGPPDSEHQKGVRRGWVCWCIYPLDSFELPTKKYLAGGFKYFLFSPLFGEDSQFDSYFSDGLKPPTSFVWWSNIWDAKIYPKMQPLQPLTISFFLGSGGCFFCFTWTHFLMAFFGFVWGFLPW